MIERDYGIRSGGAFAWFIQRLTGAILLLALLAHFWVLHFFPPEHGEITFETVMARLQHPLWRAVDLLFLAAALFHGLNGVVSVVQDYIRAPRLRIFIIGFLWAAAAFYMVIGSLTILGLSGGRL